MTPKKKAKEFIKKYKLKRNTLTLENVRDILKRQGFVLIQYNKFGRSSEKAEVVLNALNLGTYAQGKDGFVYASSTDKVVFTSNQLGEDEELYILLHEQGHIACNHPVQHGILAFNDVLCEYEANAFVFHVMEYLNNRRHRRIFSSLYALLLAAGIGLTAITPSYHSALPANSVIEPSYIPSASSIDETDAAQSYVYVARTGTVYHTDQNCSYIKGHNGVRKMTLESAEEENLPLCSRCKP